MPNYGQYTDISYKGRFDTKQANFTRRNFTKSDGYCVVDLYKGNLTTVSDIPIHIFNSFKTAKGIKAFSCHPDYPIVSGEYVDYIDGYKYLTTSQDTHQSIQNYGFITRMSDSISWKETNGTIRNQFYSLESSGIGGQDQNTKIPTSDAKKVLWMQENDYTKTIYKNQRFILWNTQSFKCTFIDYSEIGIVKVILEADELNPLDDLINNIAYNGDIVTVPNLINGVQFDVSEIEIPKTFSKTVSVYEYISSVAQPTTFTFRIDVIDPSKYTIDATTNNSITITCDAYYFTGSLVAVKQPTLEETSIPMTLKGLI